MPTTGLGKWPYPNSSDSPDGPQAFLALAQRADKISGAGVASVANAAALAALVTNGDAFNGLLAMQIDTGVVYQYKSSAWVAVLEDTGWISVASFTNSWTAALPVFYRRKNGIVYLRGQLTGGTTNPAFTLPAGFLPAAANIYFGVWSSGTGTVVSTRVNIQSSGAVVAVSGGSPGLDAISFPADA